MKRSGFPKLSYAEAKAYKDARTAKKSAGGQIRGSKQPLKRGKGLKAGRDSKLAEWSRKVRERDGNQCQWPGISAERIAQLGYESFDLRIALYPCMTGDTRIDPHHIAERSLRPDLKYSTENGITLCRTHHDWLPMNRVAAIAIGLLSDQTYEAAQKERASR